MAGGEIVVYKGASSILSKYLSAENGSEKDRTPDNFGVDIFIDDFEDEFPMPDSADMEGWVPESRRANEQRPWGQKYGARPKIHEVNQPFKAQERGWRLLDLHPNRDHKEEYYRLAGTPAELRIMLQVVRATREMTGRNINFEEWFKLWEDGFPDFKENRATTNFPLTGENPWRGKAENKPRFREWTSSQHRLDYGFRVIEYWRDRSNEAESILLSGTDLQLINHIIQIEYEGGGSVATKNKGGNLPYMKGQPLVTLYFVQDADKVGKNSDGSKKSPVTGEISFRIMDKTDDPKSPLDKISKSDLEIYADRIKTQFAEGNRYVWEKGKMVVSYRNRYQGFESWYLVKSKADGIQLVTRLLAIIDKSIDLQYLKYSVTEDEQKAYPSNPAPITVLGEQIASVEERPIADVRFAYAEIKLPKMRKPIRLVERNNVVYKS